MPEDLRQRHIAERGPLEPWEIAKAERAKQWLRIQRRAYKAVARAILRGELLRLPSPGVLCADCGDAPAKHYEHRDYSQLLSVRPVCPSCNIRSGKARNAAH